MTLEITAPSLAPPTDEAFMGKDFCPAEGLAEIAQDLMVRHGSLHFLTNYRVKVLWKRKGGQKAGRNTLGKCVRPSGLALFFSGVDWVIWVAADHARDLAGKQMEAVLFHELKHCAVDEDEVLSVVGHDLEMFLAEVEEYGLWKADLVAAAPVFRQLELGDPPVNGDGG